MSHAFLKFLALVVALACAVCAPRTAGATVLPGVDVSGVNCSANALNDLQLLNFALTLEHLDTTFFRTYNAIYFSPDNFTSAGYPASVRDRLELIEQHEAAHSATIAAAISARGGQPVPVCTYSFPVNSVADYIFVGRLLENVGVSAYDGGFNALSDPDLQAVVSTIASVEARHAAFLNELIGISPFPNATDVPQTAAQVVQLAKPFIVACPYAWNDTLQLPSIRPSGSALTTLQSQPPAAGEPAARVPGTYTLEQAQNDVKVLKYALTLEHLESTFYTQGLATPALSRAAFASANMPDSVYDELTLIREHEASHVAALSAILSARGESVPAACAQYNFSAAFTSPAAFLATAALLESTGVSAYDGAGGGISDTFLQEMAATIATVEARHSSFLNRITGQLPFPTAQDVALSPAAVLAAAAQFIIDCGNNLPSPEQLPSPVAPASPAPCPQKRASGPAASTCALSSLQTNGFSLSPAFASSTDSYTCSSSANGGAASLTVNGASPLAQYRLSVDGVDGSSRTLQPGVSSGSIAASNSSSSSFTVRVRVSLPSVLLALGDSITFGETDLAYGVYSGAERGYPRLVAAYLDSVNGDSVPSPHIENLAIDGETASSFMTGVGRTPPTDARNDQSLARENFHYAAEPTVPQAIMLNRTVANMTQQGLSVQAVFITLGFNELAALAVQGAGVAAVPQKLADYRVQYRAVLRQVRQQVPLADLYLLGYYNPFPANPSNPAAPIFDAGGATLNAVIAELAKEFDAFFVDPTPAFVGAEAVLTYLAEKPAGATLNATNNNNNAPERLPLGNIHPRDAGYQLIAQQLIARMALNGTRNSVGCARDYVIACGGGGSGGSSGDAGSSSGAASSSSGDNNNSSSGNSGNDDVGAASSLSASFSPSILAMQLALLSVLLGRNYA